MEFEEAVLMHCLLPYHRPVGKLRWRLDPDYFAPDVALIETVADCTSVSEVSVELSWHRYTIPPAGLQRGLMRARLSGQRLMNLAGGLLPSI